MNDKAVFVRRYDPISKSWYSIKIWCLKNRSKQEILVWQIANQQIRPSYCDPFQNDAGISLAMSLNESGSCSIHSRMVSYGNKTSWNINHFPSLSNVNEKDEILLAYWHYPTICKYEHKRKFCWPGTKFTIIYGLRKTKQNDEGFPIRIIGYPIKRFSGIHSSAKGFFILLSVPYTRILEFDESGKADRRLLDGSIVRL